MMPILTRALRCQDGFGLPIISSETRRLKATPPQMLACILRASIVHLVIILAFRQAVDQLSGLSFSSLAVFEMFLIFELTIVAVRYLRSA